MNLHAMDDGQLSYFKAEIEGKALLEREDETRRVNLIKLMGRINAEFSRRRMLRREETSWDRRFVEAARILLPAETYEKIKEAVRA